MGGRFPVKKKKKASKVLMMEMIKDRLANRSLEGMDLQSAQITPLSSLTKKIIIITASLQSQ